jgi:prepilin-type processing-associated H-X9-DG protein
MAFIQIIEYRTSKPAEMQAVADEWAEATEGKRKARRRVLCRDRDHDGRYVNIVFFDSYEEAMENSAMPETDRFSKQLMSFTDGPPTFYNLDVVDDRE